MKLFAARYVLPVGSEVLTEGTVVVEGGRIVECGVLEAMRAKYSGAEVREWKNCVLLPGLVNAHSHLELSGLRNRIGFTGKFVDWVGRVVTGRPESEAELAEIISYACRESLAGGVTTVGDISCQHASWRYLKKEKIRKTCFAEVFGLTGDLDGAKAYLEKCVAATETDDRLRLGISPHAPYSAGAKLYTLAAEIAGANRLRLTTHLAENREEMEFIRYGTGPWREYAQKIGKWDGLFVCPGTTPVDYFLKMDLRGQAFLLAHVNYITDEEMARFSQTGHSVVYCPRSHGYFGHPDHSFVKMLESGIHVCLGTDSLASNTSLSMLAEMRYLYRRYPAIPAEMVIRMATRNGAAALGWDDTIGSLAPGKEADLIVIRLAKPDGEPCRDILESENEPVAVMVSGEVVYEITENL